MIEKIRIPVAVLAVLFCCAVLLNRGYDWYFRALFPVKYETTVVREAEQFDFPPSLIYAIIHTESEFDASALSSAEAKGLMQLTDNTFNWALKRAGESDCHTVEDLFDPNINIHYGVYVLSLLREQFQTVETLLAAYNAGQGTVGRWLKNPDCSHDGIHLDAVPYKETDDYIRRVTETQRRYQILYSME